MKQTTVTSFIISLVYISLGTYDYFTDLKLSKYVDSISDGLDLILILPSNLFGILFRNLGMLITDSELFFFFGQIIGLIIYTSALYGMITLMKLVLIKNL
ncbi:hypothetical protein [Aquimarina spongiae]|uniref:hypothetical protein n=1 Tax=Aquimarina spongiae TaxID=570521 RepID=UPI001114D29D|nr:hypothetical protein [Aquimarina spongiae]